MLGITGNMLADWLERQGVNLELSTPIQPFYASSLVRPGDPSPKEGTLAIDAQMPCADKLKEAADQLVYRMASWSAALEHAITDNLGSTAVIDVLHDWFENPITLSNNAYTMLGYTKDDAPPHAIWAQTMEQGFMSYGLIDASEFYVQRKKLDNADAPFITSTPSIEDRFMFAPILVGKHRLGQLTVIEKNRPITKGDMDVAAYASKLLALELLKSASISMDNSELASSLLAEVLGGELTDDRVIRQRMVTLGWRLEGGLWALCIGQPEQGRHLPPTLLQDVSAILPGKYGVWHEGLFVVLIDSRSRGPIGTKALSKLVGLLKEHGLKAGLSPRFKHVSDLPRHAAYAYHALQAGLEHDPELTVYDYQSYNLLRIRDLLDENGGVASYLHPAVEALREADSAGEYYETLRVYLLNNGSTKRTLEQLHIHRSTLSYRLRRIQELLDIDLDDADTFFELALSMRLLG